MLSIYIKNFRFREAWGEAIPQTPRPFKHWYLYTAYIRTSLNNSLLNKHKHKHKSKYMYMHLRSSNHRIHRRKQYRTSLTVVSRFNCKQQSCKSRTKRFRSLKHTDISKTWSSDLSLVTAITATSHANHERAALSHITSPNFEHHCNRAR